MTTLLSSSGHAVMKNVGSPKRCMCASAIPRARFAASSVCGTSREIESTALKYCTAADDPAVVSPLFRFSTAFCTSATVMFRIMVSAPTFPRTLNDALSSIRYLMYKLYKTKQNIPEWKCGCAILSKCLVYS